MKTTRPLAKSTSKGVKPLKLNRKTVITLTTMGIILLGLAVFLWIQVNIDRWILFSHDALRSIESIATIGKTVSKYGMSIILFINLIYLVFAFNNANLRDATKVTLLVLFMFALVGLGGDLLKEIINRPRPFVTYAGEYTAFSDAVTPAFPSGHATKSMAMVLPFLVLIPARDKWHIGVKILLAGIALSVSYSRVFLGAHYASDVLAGIGLTMICLPLVTRLTNMILGKMTPERFNTAGKIWAAVVFGLMVFLAVG